MTVRVLLAEVDPVERELIREALKGYGYEVLSAEDGDEALALALRERPHAVLVDIVLPRRDGYSLLLHLRAEDATRDIPVVFLSSLPAHEHAQIALGLGAAAYIEKPWSGAELLASLSAAVPREGKR